MDAEEARELVKRAKQKTFYDKTKKGNVLIKKYIYTFKWQDASDFWETFVLTEIYYEANHGGTYITMPVGEEEIEVIAAYGAHLGFDTTFDKVDLKNQVLYIRWG